MTSVKHIPARCRPQTPTPRWTMDTLDTDLLIPIELSQATTSKCVQDLRENEAGEAYDTSIAHTPPSQPCGQFQAQRSDTTNRDSIAHCRTNTPSQREIFSQATHNNSFRTATPSQSEIFSQTTHNNHFRTNTSSQSEIFIETATEYDASSEASSRETSRPSSPESGNLTVRSVYWPLPEIAILHKTMHDAIHAVRDQQGRAVTRRFLQQQQEVTASKLKCMSQIQKASTPDPPPPKSNAFLRQGRARLEMANGTTSSSSEESDCENPRKAKFLALKRLFESTSTSRSTSRWLNMQNYFLPGPAHPLKSDNVAKHPPVMLGADQDPPRHLKATL